MFNVEVKSTFLSLLFLLSLPSPHYPSCIELRCSCMNWLGLAECRCTGLQFLFRLFQIKITLYTNCDFMILQRQGSEGRLYDQNTDGSKGSFNSCEKIPFCNRLMCVRRLMTDNVNFIIN